MFLTLLELKVLKQCLGQGGDLLSRFSNCSFSVTLGGLGGVTDMTVGSSPAWMFSGWPASKHTCGCLRQPRQRDREAEERSWAWRGPRKELAMTRRAFDFCLLATFRALFQRMDWVELIDVVQAPLKRSTSGGARINIEGSRKVSLGIMASTRGEQSFEELNTKIRVFVHHQPVTSHFQGENCPAWWKMGGLPTSCKKHHYRSMMCCVCSVSCV